MNILKKFLLIFLTVEAQRLRMYTKPGDVSKVGYFLDIAISIADSEFKIKSLYNNDLILNIASEFKETVQKLKFLDSPRFTDTLILNRFQESVILRRLGISKNSVSF